MSSCPDFKLPLERTQLQAQGRVEVGMEKLLISAWGSHGIVTAHAILARGLTQGFVGL